MKPTLSNSYAGNNPTAACALASVVAAIIALSVLPSGIASAACPPGESRNCVNLDLVPQIGRQIAAGENVSLPPKQRPGSEPARAYTGPTVGAAPNLRRAPTVGYRWAID